jgi:hypothetical protein
MVVLSIYSGINKIMSTIQAFFSIGIYENMKVSAFSGYSWPTHINGMYVCVLGIPKCKFPKQMIKKYLVTEYLFITEGKFYFKDFKNTLYDGVLFDYT